MRSTQGEEGEENSPVDKYRLVYFAFLATGVGYILPWSTIMAAADYFLTVYPGSGVIFALSWVYFVTVWVTVLISTFTVEWLNYATKARIGFIIFNLSLIYMAFVEIGFRPMPVQVSFKVLLFVGVVFASSASIGQTNVLGLSSVLPYKYNQAVLTGESAAGLISFASRVITKASISSLHINTIVHMGISCFISFTCFIIFNIVLKSKFVKYYASRRNLVSHPESDMEMTDWREGMQLGEVRGYLVLFVSNFISSNRIMSMI